MAQATTDVEPVEVKHPAKFGDDIIAAAQQQLDFRFQHHDGYVMVLDPFAGTGRVHELTSQYATFGVELEKEWNDIAVERAAEHAAENSIAANYLGDVMELEKSWSNPGLFDVVFTSPCYGNRMADHHNALEKCKECKGVGTINSVYDPWSKCEKCDGVGRRVYKRNTYKHYLGRDLTPNSAAAMQWGFEYRRFHIRAWVEVMKVLKPGGWFLLNVKDHIRDDKRKQVAGFHVRTLQMLGLIIHDIEIIPTTGNGMGKNREKRVPGELLITLHKPTK